MAATQTTSRDTADGARSAPQAGLSPARKRQLDARPIKRIWSEYRRTRSEELRNYLLERFLPLVRYSAERIHARLPDEVDIEDLMSAGVFGLLDAIDAYDLERNVKFETYCAPRIRGAILDELRNMDQVPRLVRHRVARVSRAQQQVEKATGRPATEAEVAQILGVSEEEYEKIRKDTRVAVTISINRPYLSGDGDREVREIDVIRDESQRNPLRELQRRDLRELITRGLSRAEQLIVVLYYYEGMTMKEIGATLDLSESRVSQMHSSILARLKAQMQHRTRELEPLD